MGGEYKQLSSKICVNSAALKDDKDRISSCSTASPQCQGSGAERESSMLFSRHSGKGQGKEPCKQHPMREDTKFTTKVQRRFQKVPFEVHSGQNSLSLGLGHLRDGSRGSGCYGNQRRKRVNRQFTENQEADPRKRSKDRLSSAG